MIEIKILVETKSEGLIQVALFHSTPVEDKAEQLMLNMIIDSVRTTQAEFISKCGGGNIVEHLFNEEGK